MALCSNTNLGWAASGTLLYMWNASVSPGVWVPIAKLENITGAQGKRAMIDVTTHDSPGGGTGFVQKIASLADSGNVTAAGIWDPTDPTHNELDFRGLKTAFNDAIIRNWKIVYPSSPVYSQTFCAFCDGYAPDAKIKDVLRVNFSLMIVQNFSLVLGNPSTP